MHSINIKVITKSKQQKVVRQADGFFKIYIWSAPEKGKANQELIKVLAKHLAIKQKQVKIVRGEHSREKLISIE